MSGNLRYRLTVVDPAGATFTPGDTTIGDDHFWVTSQRRADHPWIESPPSGDGRKIDMVTGKVSDAEYTLRVIDVPEPVCTEYTATLVQDATALGLDPSYLSNGWTIDGNSMAYPFPTNWWTADSLYPVWSGSVLFAWWDNWPTTPLVGNAGPLVRESYIEKTVTGLTPGETYGITFSVNWSLATGNGNLFVEIAGTTTSRLSLPSPGITIWTATTLENDSQLRLRAAADGSGNITIRLGGENYKPSANVLVQFKDVAIYSVACTSTPAIAPGARYVTGWLADADARQQLLGRAAYLEQTLDNGVTWDMLQPGYVTSLKMADSLVYDITIGDTRRVERTRGAWRDIQPLTNATDEHMTALLGGFVYQGFEPHAPRLGLPLFRVVAYQAPSGDIGDANASDGYLRLNYIDGPMPPGGRKAGSQHSVNLVRRTVNDRAQPYFDHEATWSTTAPSGSFPGLRAALFLQADESLVADDLVPLGQNFKRLSLGAGGGGVPVIVERGQEFINGGLEVLLRLTNAAPVFTVGHYFYLLVTPREVSSAFPLFVRDHPVDIEVALLTRHGIAYDSASAASVRAALGADLAVALRFDDPAQTIQSVADQLHAMFGYATRISAAGAREFFVFRAFVATTPALSIDTNDLRAEGGPTYDLGEDSRKNRLVVKQQYFRTIEPDDEAIIDAPSAVEVVDSSFALDYSTDGGATVDADTVGALEVSYDLNGHVALAADGPVSGDYESSVPVSQSEWGKGLGRYLFAHTARGIQEATVLTLRDAADADAAEIGDAVVLDADHVPNAQIAQTPTSQRGGARWWRVAQRTEASEGAELLLADAGTGVVYGNAVTLAMTADTYDPGHFWAIDISGTTALNTDGAWLELEVLLSATVPSPSTPGVRHTILDSLEMVDALGAVLDPFPYRVGPVPYNRTTWVRARAFLVGGTPGAWSDWTSVGSGGNPGTGLSNLRVTAVDVDEVTLTWDNADATNNVRVYYRLNDTGAYTLAVTGAVGLTSWTVTGLTIDSLYGFRVVLWDGVAEVGTALLAQARTLAGDLFTLIISSITQNNAYALWGNSHPTFSVKIQIRETGTATYTTLYVLPATSVRWAFINLQPLTSYDVRIVLVNATGGEYGTPLTGTFVTLASSGTLLPPTNPAVFAGSDPSGGGFSRGLYGLQVYADLTNPPHLIVIEEAVETAVGSGTPGTYIEADIIPAQQYGPTVYATTAPNDLLLRYLKAKARLPGYSDSSATTALSIDPWSTTPPPTGPINGSVQFSVVGLAEDATDTGEFPIPTGAIITIAECTNAVSARLRLYESDAARTADAGRAITQIPQTGAGVLLDVVFLAGAYAINLNPLVQIINRADPPEATTMIYYSATRYEPGSGDCDFQLTYSVATVGQPTT